MRFPAAQTLLLLSLSITLFATAPTLAKGEPGKAASLSVNNGVIEVSFSELLQAMQEEQGYDPTTTTNVGRFQSNVLLRLARAAIQRQPDGPPLLLRHQDWYAAFLECTGLTDDTAPIFSKLAFRYRQDQLVDYRQDRVLKKAAAGSIPRLALNVKVSWPEDSGLPKKYSFEDTLSKPKLKVSNYRLLRYRLLDFGDMTVYDEMEGLSGQPTSGLLGVLFKLIGEGHVTQARMIALDGGVLVSRTYASKGIFSVNPIVTVLADGQAKKGLHQMHDDDGRLSARLNQQFQIEYVPFR